MPKSDYLVFGRYKLPTKPLVQDIRTLIFESLSQKVLSWHQFQSVWKSCSASLLSLPCQDTTFLARKRYMEFLYSEVLDFLLLVDSENEEKCLIGQVNIVYMLYALYKTQPPLEPKIPVALREPYWKEISMVYEQWTSNLEITKEALVLLDYMIAEEIMTPVIT